MKLASKRSMFYNKKDRKTLFLSRRVCFSITKATYTPRAKRSDASEATMSTHRRRFKSELFVF